MDNPRTAILAFVAGFGALMAVPVQAQTQLDDRCTRAIENEVLGRYPQAESVDAMAVRGTPMSQYEVVYNGGGHYADAEGARTPFLFECISSARTGHAYGVRIRAVGEREDRGAPAVARTGHRVVPRAVPAVSGSVSGPATDALVGTARGSQPASEVLGVRDAQAEGDGGADDAVAPAADAPPPPLPTIVRGGVAPAVRPASDLLGGNKVDEPAAAPAEAPAEAPVDAAPAEAPVDAPSRLAVADDAVDAAAQPLQAAAPAAAQAVEASLLVPGGAAAALACGENCEPPPPLPVQPIAETPLAAQPAALSAPDAALTRLARDFPQAQIAVLQFVAYAATAASVCSSVELSTEAVVGTVSSVVQATSIDAPAAQAASRRDAALIAYGMLTGLMLREAAADQAAFCGGGAGRAGGPASWSFMRTSSGG